MGSSASPAGLVGPQGRSSGIFACTTSRRVECLVAMLFYYLKGKCFPPCMLTIVKLFPFLSYSFLFLNIFSMLGVMAQTIDSTAGKDRASSTRQSQTCNLLECRWLLAMLAAYTRLVFHAGRLEAPSISSSSPSELVSTRSFSVLTEHGFSPLLEGSRSHARGGRGRRPDGGDSWR